MCASRSHWYRWYAIGLEMFRALLWISWHLLTSPDISWHLLTSHPTSQAIGAVTGMEEVAKKMEAAQGKDIAGHMNNRFISSYHFVNMQYKYAICILQVVWKICTVSHDVLIAQEFPVSNISTLASQNPQVPKAEQFAEKNLQAMPVPLTISYNLLQSDSISSCQPFWPRMYRCHFWRWRCKAGLQEARSFIAAKSLVFASANRAKTHGFHIGVY